MKKIIITIDGPAGAGKSTVSKLLAEKLNYIYIDTGALYRACALYIQKNQCDIQNEDQIKIILSGLNLCFKKENNVLKLYNNNEDISGLIRKPEISMIASKCSSKKIVREYLLNVQRELAKNKAVVFEGRDMGTVVFPEAKLKFFLFADHKIRAQRRYNELIEKSNNISLEKVSNDMKKRDDDDSNRKLAPLKPAHDAINIDSTEKTVEQVVDLMIKYFNKV